MAQLPDRSDCVLGFVQEDLRGLENRLAAYPGNTARMQGKVERLREMQERGVIPYTVWDFPFRGDYAGDGSYNGNCYPQIIEQCVWRLTEEGEVVMDPWRGPGCYDLHPVRGDIEQADARRLPAVDGQADLVFMHPPYWDMVRYSGGAVEGDLSRAASLEQFFDMLRQVFSECERVLRPGRYLCVFLGDLINGGRFQPLGRRAANILEELGMEDAGYAVKLAHGDASRRRSGVIVAELAATRNLKVSHDVVLFFRKGG